MKRKLTRNIGLKILSLLVAYLIWLLVISIDDPIISDVIRDVPVQILNENSVTAIDRTVSVLEGDTWREEVTYWMPFHDGQGLHDAPWRSSFGGNIYQTNGSHGCVNLPYNVAQTIYENIEAGMAILLYK